MHLMAWHGILHIRPVAHCLINTNLDSMICQQGNALGFARSTEKHEPQWTRAYIPSYIIYCGCWPFGLYPSRWPAHLDGPNVMWPCITGSLGTSASALIMQIQGAGNRSSSCINLRLGQHGQLCALWYGHNITACARNTCPTKGVT